MEWLFGHRMTPEEMLRKNQRALNKAVRDLERERAKMEQQEKKLINDIKKLAKEGQMVCWASPIHATTHRCPICCLHLTQHNCGNCLSQLLILMHISFLG